MRIVTVTTFFPNSVDRLRAVFVEHLVRAMRRFCTITVVAPIPYAPPVSSVKRWASLRKIAHTENRDGFNILHPRFPVVPKIYWFSGLGFFIGTFRLLRRLSQEQGTILIHSHCAYPDGVGAAIAARLLGLRYVITAHGSDINVIANRATIRPQIRWAIQGANGVISVSRALEEKIKVLARDPLKRSICIPCAGFDPAMFSVRLKAPIRYSLSLSTTAIIAVFVGHLVPIKGVDFLVSAWAQLWCDDRLRAGDRLIIIGEGACRKTLEQLVLNLGLQASVSFLGSLPQSDVSCWISASDFLCLPSHNEGTPNVVVEALASGVPIVATRVGGVPDLVQEGINGYLVWPGEASELAQAIAKTISRSWNADEIASSASHLTWDSLARQNYQFLQSIAAQEGVL